MENNFNTAIKKIKEPDFSKEVVIKELRATKETIDWHYNQLKKALGDKATDQQIWQRLNSLVLRDNVFNEAMKILVPCYEMKLTDEEIKSVSAMIRKNNPSLEKAPDQLVNMMARRMIEKQLIFACVAHEWNITVSDDEVKKMLEAYYKSTNQPIRDVIDNPTAMAGVKNTILEQKITDEICKKLKWKADWEAIKKASEINNAQVLKEQEEKTKKEEKGDGTIIEK